eukprot:TRINITY_DN50122_c0_g1_i1.p2 TRINITY_DN50122_c0_g1~~TRINITY_DN50122_c0_g1_i1.p2  ORF type:complete len:110 (-),score=1.24 TRINITY_DN50122_c0_g1_i1:160-489(-)
MPRRAGLPSAPAGTEASAVVAEQEFGDRDRDMLARDDDLAPGDRPAVGEDHHRLALAAVQFDDRAPAHLQQLMNGHGRLTEHHRYIDVDFADCGHARLPLAGPSLAFHA